MLLIAALCDLRERRVPNWLLVIGGGVAVLMSLSVQSIPLRELLVGGIVGLLVFMPLYVVSAMGAGDIKLMAVVGTFLGVKGVLLSALFTALAGGLLALGFALARAGTQLPYAVAILAGVTGYVAIRYLNPAILNFPFQDF
ncbi:MAG: prepilin peptidase [Betaproteobacteria bacterium]|nr:prepilin peptidase [Betaproteobacteria bacterium]